MTRPGDALMGDYAPLVILNVAVGLLVAGLSWRLAELREDGAYLRYWALYWAATTSSIAAGVVLSSRSGVRAAPHEAFQLFTVQILLALRPALIALAAASLFRRLDRKAVWWTGTAAFSAGLAATILDRSGANTRQPAHPAPAVFLMASAAAFVFAFAYFRRQRAQGFVAQFTTAVILVYALHLAAFGLAGYGFPVYPASNSPMSAGSTVTVVLGCLLAFGLGLDALRQAQQARHHAMTLWLAAQDGMILLGNSGIVLQANPAYARIVDRPLDSIGEKPVSEAFSEATRARVAATIFSSLSSTLKNAPRIVHADLWNGREVWLEFSFSPLPGGNAVLSIVRDATERILAQQRYTMMVSRTPIGIHFYAFDPERGLVFTGANQAADQILGVPHQPLVGKLIEEAFPALAGTDIPASYRAVAITGKPFRRDEIVYADERIEGAFEVVCFQLTASSLAVMFNNITERKRTEAALRASEARYRLITDNSTDMISVFDRAGAFLFASPSCRNLLGFEPDQMIGKTAADFCHPEDLHTLQSVQASFLSAGTPQSATFRCRRADNTWVWVEAFARLVPPEQAQGTPRVIAVTRDVTERRKLEEQFRRAQRLESIGRLAGGVAHDFNNLLTVINGYAALLQAGSGGAQQTRDLASSILQAGERAAALTRHLLAFSRRQHLEPVPLHLNQIILDAERILLRLIGEDIQFVLDLDAATGLILADPTQLHQVLSNLAVNARDAIAGRGTITVSTRLLTIAEDAAPARQIPAGAYCVLSFRDTGCGMSPYVQEKIFEPFFTTKTPGQGTGLGLSTVFGIVQQSNGHIQVSSEPGRGSEFRLYFPLLDDAIPSPDAGPPARSAAPAGETILVVEDQPEVAEYITAVLESHGFRVIAASSGDHAVHVLSNLARPPRAVLSDVVMPGMDGLALAARIRESHPQLPIVLMSGNEHLPQSHRDTTVSFLAKPFTEDALLLALRARLA